MDIFHEYIVTKKKELKDYLITLLLIGAAIVLTFVFAMLTMMYSQYLSSIGLLLIVGVWWGALYLIKARNIEFEYIANPIYFFLIIRRSINFNAKKPVIPANTIPIMYPGISDIVIEPPLAFISKKTKPS